MRTGSLAEALEYEHHEIDAGIAAFTAAPENPQPLTRAIRALRHNRKKRRSSTREPTKRCPRQRQAGCALSSAPGSYPRGGCASGRG